jgi:hypothetical protein
LDTLLKPYGYVCKSGKILNTGEAAAITPETTAAATKKTAALIGDNVEDDYSEASPTPAVKKRKIITGKGKGGKAKSIKGENSDDD